MQLNPSMVTFEAAQVNRPPINKSSVLTITEVNIVILTTNLKEKETNHFLQLIRQSLITREDLRSSRLINPCSMTENT